MWGLRGGRKRPRGLRFWVLQILARKPRTGAEILQDMETLTHGWWRPSPGSIYPLLEQMTGEGLIQRRPDGRYELSEQFQSTSWGYGGFPGPLPRTPEEAVHELSGFVAYLEDLSRSDPAGFRAQLPAIAALAERLRRLAS
jgi:hypothetical protein